MINCMLLLVVYTFSEQAEIKMTIAKKIVIELVLVMTLLSHNLIEAEPALKQIFEILMGPSKKDLIFNRNFLV